MLFQANCITVVLPLAKKKEKEITTEGASSLKRVLGRQLAILLMPWQGRDLPIQHKPHAETSVRLAWQESIQYPSCSGPQLWPG